MKERTKCKTWKGKDGRTRSIRWRWDRNTWYILPTVHYEHVFDPLTITFHFLKFVVEYHSVMRYTVEEFKDMLKNRGTDITKAEPGYFDL